MHSDTLEVNMTIRLDHTIVPVKDKRGSAEFFAGIPSKQRGTSMATFKF